ncbi:MAG: fused MFS/spermidine synthase [Phycisphaeraceae bacterium]|nr:fused MFS/spermidine synthase [Phycisphaeraceae bacterium]
MSDARPIHWRFYSAALGLALVSGMAALSHQLLWTRRLIDLLGAGHESSARVFGAFFLGLALGAAAASGLLRRVNRPWRWIASIELAVILLSLPALLLPRWTGWIWPWLGEAGLVGWQGGAVKLVASLIVVLPPATAMGMTLPILVPAVLRGGAQLGRHGTWIYAINTLGGVIGLGLVMLALLQWLGAWGSMIAAMGMNAIVVLWALLLDRWDQPRTMASAGPTATSTPISPDVRRWSMILAFMSGFAILGFEVAALQVLMLVAPLSFYAPSAILMVIIFILALGAAIAPALRRGIGSSIGLMIGVLILAGILTVTTPPWFFQVAEQTGELVSAPSLGRWFLNLAILTALSLGPAMLPAALVFPLILGWVSAEGDRGGRTLGWLLAANGIGGLLGAEFAYRLLLPMLGPHQTIGVIGLLYLFSGLALAIHMARPRWIPVLPTVAATVACVLMITMVLGDLPLFNQRMGWTALAQRSGREGTVAVIEGVGLGRSMLMSNQYVLGGTAARWDQERQAHLPMLLHPQPKRVAAIGLATGITPGAALQHRAVESVTAIELSPLVIELAEHYFAEYNGNIVGDPRARIIVEDGRTYIASAREQFDVVLGDLFLPWGPGEARLYSREHFEAVKMSLAPGGVFCQWLAMYQLTPEQFRSIAATFQRVFPRTHVVIGGFQSHQPMLGLVGFKDAQWDWQVIEARTREVRDDGIGDPLARWAAGLRLLHLGELAEASVLAAGPGSASSGSELPGAMLPGDRLPGVRINTLDNMWVELDAGLRRLTQRPDQVYHIGPRWLNELNRLEGSFLPAEGLSESARLRGKLIAWDLMPVSARDQSGLIDLYSRMPFDLIGDAQGDPTRWPGDRRVLGPGR